MDAEHVDVSVVISTYNRCDSLKQTIDAIVVQEPEGISYELIVVDNNCTDSTKQMVSEYAARHPRVRYVFEGRQGVSYGRNAGIAAAKAEVIAFTDDDVRPSSDWISCISELSRRYVDADYVGGQVLPLSNRPLPSWAHERQGPFALQDHGPNAMNVSPENPYLLITANLFVRRSALNKAGLFDPRTQRVKGGIGSTEDVDWERKVWSAGGFGVYDPALRCFAEVQEDRLTKSYHRSWHLGNGKFNAIARNPEIERSGQRIFDVPGHMYRRTLRSIAGVLRSWRQADEKRRVDAEGELLFCWGYLWHRWKSYVGLSRS